MYEITLTDDLGTDTTPTLNVPLTESELEGATDVQTLDMNIYTDFFAKKRLWSHTWKYMSEDDFNTLKGYYDRQFTLYKYPRITIDQLGVDEVPARMTITPQNIIDNCGTVENVRVTFRESTQLDGGS